MAAGAPTVAVERGLRGRSVDWRGMLFQLRDPLLVGRRNDVADGREAKVLFLVGSVETNRNVIVLRIVGRFLRLDRANAALRAGGHQTRRHGARDQSATEGRSPEFHAHATSPPSLPIRANGTPLRLQLQVSRYRL